MVSTQIRYQTDESDRTKLTILKNRFAGQRCVIIGNGPSLNDVSLKLLKDEHTFGVNSIFLKQDSEAFVPSFYVIEDNHVVEDNIDRINVFADKPDYCFFPARYKRDIRGSENTIFFDCDYGFYWDSHPFGGIPRFSRDASEVLFAGQSVTHINFQLAYYLGFSEVYLIGMDFNYTKPSSVIVEGNTLTSTEDDPNHFDPSYFGKGKKWHDPKIDLVALNYQKAKQVFEANGRKILNATAGGGLEIFPRVEYESVFSN